LTYFKIFYNGPPGYVYKLLEDDLMSRDFNTENEAKAPRVGSRKKLIIGGLAAVFGIAALNSAIYTVSPSHMANVRRMNSVLYKDPIGKGPHLKLPFIDTVDYQQVSLRTLHIPTFAVNTVDNQKITLDINFNYTVPKAKVNELLYGIGRGGIKAIDAAIIPVAMDRAGRVFSVQNTMDISKNREVIQKEVQDKVFTAVRNQFGIEPHSIQIAKIHYSQAFIDSNEAAVREKNNSVAEIIKQDVQAAIAAQKVIIADGKAKATVETARGASESKIIVAEATLQKQKLDGEGQSARRAAEIAPFNNRVDLYLQYLDALKALKWDGIEPTVKVGPGGSATVVVTPQPKP
jgi:membrane protease subunit HflC